jgi:hypothetical protein
MNILENKQKITELMVILEKELKNNDYNFQHPRILEISKELDKLVLQLMKNKHL